MWKKIVLLGLLLVWSVKPINAQESDGVVTIVSLVREKDKWVSQENWLSSQVELIDGNGLKSTWLFEAGALEESSQQLKPDSDLEVGLLMEVDRALAQKLGLTYDKLGAEHEAKNVFLSGYSLEERKIIIDEVFYRFKQVYGYYPKSVGAWFIDSWSIGYMRDVYGIEAVLLVAEQYGTDHHTIRGHVWQEPYYPSRKHSLIPGRNEDLLDVVVVQWAGREPLDGYGYYREHSNFSVQANDYTQQGLGSEFLEKLMETYLSGSSLKQLTLGIEVGQEGATYWPQFEDQINEVKNQGLETMTMSEFARVYKEENLQNPLLRVVEWIEDDRWAGWITTEKYRIGLISGPEGIYVRDWRVFRESQDDLWWMADRRSELWRQTEAIVDEVGLGNKLQLNNIGGIPEIEQTDGLKLIWPEGWVEFDSEGMETSFEIDEKQPVLVVEKGETTRIYPTELEGLVKNTWPIFYLHIASVVLGVGLLMFLITREMSWWSWLVPSLGAFWWWQEWWLLSGFNDVGWSFWQNINFKGWTNYFIAPLLLVGLSLILYWWVYKQTKSRFFSFIAQFWFWFGSNLGFLYVWFRKLPLDPGLITGTKPNMVWGFLDVERLSLERLRYAFSAGQIQLPGLENMVRVWGWGVFVAAMIFLLMNFGGLLLGHAVVAVNAIKTKKWWLLGLLGTLMSLSSLSQNKVDIRFTSIFDLGVAWIGAWGLSWWLATKIKTRSMKGIVFLVSVIIAWPMIASVRERNTELNWRRQTMGADRAKAVAWADSLGSGDFFTWQTGGSNQDYVTVPVGIEEYVFVNYFEMKESLGERLLENSYGLVAKKGFHPTQ